MDHHKNFFLFGKLKRQHFVLFVKVRELIGKITLIREKYCEVSVKFNFAL